MPPASRLGGDAGRSERVAADLRSQTRVSRAPADHAPDVDAVHRQSGKDAHLADRRAEEWSAARSADPCRVKILIEVGFELVVRRHFVPFATGFFDSSLEESGFEPLVPLEKGRAIRRADRDRLSACSGNCKNDGGTTSSNPACTRGESANFRFLRRACEKAAPTFDSLKHSPDFYE